MGSLFQGHLPMQHHEAQLVFSQGVGHEMQGLDKSAEDNHFLRALRLFLCILHPNSPHEAGDIDRGERDMLWCGRQMLCPSILLCLEPAIAAMTC